MDVKREQSAIAYSKAFKTLRQVDPSNAENAWVCTNLVRMARVNAVIDPPTSRRAIRALDKRLAFLVDIDEIPYIKHPELLATRAYLDAVTAASIYDKDLALDLLQKAYRAGEEPDSTEEAFLHEICEVALGYGEGGKPEADERLADLLRQLPARDGSASDLNLPQYLLLTLVATAPRSVRNLIDSHGESFDLLTLSRAVQLAGFTGPENAVLLFQELSDKRTISTVEIPSHEYEYADALASINNLHLSAMQKWKLYNAYAIEGGYADASLTREEEGQVSRKSMKTSYRPYESVYWRAPQLLKYAVDHPDEAKEQFWNCYLSLKELDSIRDAHVAATLCSIFEGTKQSERAVAEIARAVYSYDPSLSRTLFKECWQSALQNCRGPNLRVVFERYYALYPEEALMALETALDELRVDLADAFIPNEDLLVTERWRDLSSRYVALLTSYGEIKPLAALEHFKQTASLYMRHGTSGSEALFWILPEQGAFLVYDLPFVVEIHEKIRHDTGKGPLVARDMALLAARASGEWAEYFTSYTIKKYADFDKKLQAWQYGRQLMRDPCNLEPVVGYSKESGLSTLDFSYPLNAALLEMWRVDPERAFAVIHCLETGELKDHVILTAGGFYLRTLQWQGRLDAEIGEAGHRFALWESFAARQFRDMPGMAGICEHPPYQGLD